MQKRLLRHRVVPESDHRVRVCVSEPLEPRRLFTVIEADVLVARGSEGADVFSLRRSGTDDVIITISALNAGHSKLFVVNSTDNSVVRFDDPAVDAGGCTEVVGVEDDVSCHSPACCINLPTTRSAPKY